MTDTATDQFIRILKDNRKGANRGIYSICSAHPEVLKACLKQAQRDNSLIIIESTSNQVDQYGGYTGMKPIDFSAYVHTLAYDTGFPQEQILLGGDHLGPNAWRNLPADEAMAKACSLIEEYVKAGYRKIHLDASMFCADDPGDRFKPLPDEVVADRTARLCWIAENTWNRYIGDDCRLVYIIGTEVPVPGGAQESEAAPRPTEAKDAARTLSIAEKYFKIAGLERAWERVYGLVVQPGVEFGDDHVFQYDPTQTGELSKQILLSRNLVYETHSTDYQPERCLRALVEDHFCILKVGPWLTFAYREALYALEAMEKELLGENNANRSNLAAALEMAMCNDPRYWKPYYRGGENEISFKRKFSFSDRSRYYWPHPDMKKAITRLYQNLLAKPIPLSLLSQFMPQQFRLANEGIIKPLPDDLVHSHIMEVAAIYARACGLNKVENQQEISLSLPESDPV